MQFTLTDLWAHMGLFAKLIVAVMTVMLGSYLVRMGVLFGIALLLGELPFIDLPVLVVTIAVVHISLLAWETRHVSLSLAAPGLKPGRTNH